METETPPVASSSRQLFWIKYTHLSTKVGKDFKSQLEYDHPEKPNFNSVGFTIVTEFSETEFGITTGKFNGLPDGLSINSNSVISGVPTKKGYYFIYFYQQTVIAAGGVNGAIRLSVELGDPVLLTNLVKASVSSDIDQLFQFSTNSNYNTGTITSSTGLPAGFYFDGNRLKGRHTTPGTFKVKVFFTEPVSQFVFSKEITILNYQAAPSIFTSSLPTAKVGQGFTADSI